jgi:ABC-type protease/lipase transport system fused ATPase/permease subunit
VSCWSIKRIMYAEATKGYEPLRSVPMDEFDSLVSPRTDLTDHFRLDLVKVSYSIPVKSSQRILIRNINFNLQSGDLCALMGPSGAGKRYFIINIICLLNNIVLQVHC